jgi:hypothetical protein
MFALHVAKAASFHCNPKLSSEILSVIPVCGRVKGTQAIDIYFSVFSISQIFLVPKACNSRFLREKIDLAVIFNVLIFPR